MKWKVLSHNPCQFVSKCIINEKEKLSFDDNDIEKILSLMSNLPISKIVLFALFTGCRINEILNIQWNDIDFIHKVFTVRNKPNFKTKTGKIRQIPISDKLFFILNDLYRNRCVDKDNILNFNNTNEYVFLNSKGVRHSRSRVTIEFKKYLRKAGIDEKFHFHCLRHTFITNLIKKGVSINFVKEIVGHSDIATTLNYVHIVTEDLRKAVNQI